MTALIRYSNGSPISGDSSSEGESSSPFSFGSSSPICIRHSPSSLDGSPSSSSLNSDDLRGTCPQICEICGDASNGYHFTVPTCHACKIFFRRAVLSRRTFKCNSATSCVVSKDSRNACRKCRFDRCIQAGMNPLGIRPTNRMADPQKVKAILNRQREIQSEFGAERTLAVSAAPRSFFVPHHISKTPEELTCDLIGLLCRVEDACDRLRRSTFNPQPIDPELTLQNIVNSSSKLGSLYEEMPGWPLPPRLFPHWRPIEDHIAQRIPLPVGEPRLLPPSTKHWQLANIVYMAEYVKTFDFYHKLSNSDKLVLLRHVTLFASHLTSAYFSYANKSGVTLHPDGRTPVHSQRAMSSPVFRTTHVDLITALARERIDRAEFALLKALVVCCDTLDGLSESGRAVLSSSKTRLSRSLLAYCFSRHGPSQAPAAFASLLSLIQSTIRVSKCDKEVRLLTSALGLYKNRCSLLKEIYES